jgi:hypothetical protein
MPIFAPLYLYRLWRFAQMVDTEVLLRTLQSTFTDYYVKFLLR